MAGKQIFHLLVCNNHSKKLSTMSSWDKQSAQRIQSLDRHRCYNYNYFYNCYYSHTIPVQKKKAGAGSLLGLTGGASFGSMTTLCSDAGGKGSYEITGEVLVGVQYKDGQLSVHVNRARDLAVANSNGFSDPYVKTYLLPDRSTHSKRKTSIKKKTLDPVYNETLKVGTRCSTHSSAKLRRLRNTVKFNFVNLIYDSLLFLSPPLQYKVSPVDIGNRILWLSVWNWDQFGRNKFLGEVRLPLASMNLKDGTDHWYSLQDKEVAVEPDTYHGQVKVGLMFTPDTKKSGKTVGTLSIMIKQARDLPQMDAKGGLTDSFVKCHLLPDRSSHGKRKTAVVKNNLTPVWEERFTYEKVVLEELTTERVLEITAWNFNKGSSNDFIGGLRIGPLPPRIGRRKEWMDSIGDELSHWETMLACPGRWVEQWHTFRTTMDPRSVLLV